MECLVCMEIVELVDNQACNHQICVNCTKKLCICPVCRTPWPTQLKYILDTNKLPVRVDDALKQHLSKMINLEELTNECVKYQSNDTVNMLLIYMATLDPKKYQLISVLRPKKVRVGGSLLNFVYGNRR